MGAGVHRARLLTLAKITELYKLATVAPRTSTTFHPGSVTSLDKHLHMVGRLASEVERDGGL